MWRTDYSFGKRSLLGLLPLSASVLVLAALTSCGYFAHLTRSGPDTFPKASECAKCHIEIHREWSASAHAHAFTDPAFRKATDDYRFAKCLGCHAPQPEWTRSAPEARTQAREEGVTCVSCHLEAGRLAGPHKMTAKVQPHPISAKPERYHDSLFCGRCHQGTYAEWQRAAAREKVTTCQECHMPPVKRKATQATGVVSKAFVAMEKETQQRRHTFAAPVSAQALGLLQVSLERQGEELALAIENRVPHGMPTGDFGVRVLLVEVFAVDQERQAERHVQWELVKEMKTAVPARSRARWRFPRPAGAQSLVVRISRPGAGEEKSRILYKSELTIP